MKRVMIAALAIAVVALFVGTAAAQTPGKMNYQVMLTNDSDEPLAEQEVDLFFGIYDAEVAGTLVWSELHSNVMTNSIGVASVVLGSTSPLTNYYFQGPAWLEISVDAQTLSPRRELVAAPYALHADDADHLGQLPAAYYALAEDLYVPSIINTPSNPVDWTNLKNVPAGFADGTDDAGGAGDGHSLDADDGAPVDAVYVDADGDVGIGVTAPANKLVVGPNGSGLSYAQFANSTTGYGLVDGFRVGTSGNTAFIGQNENSSINILTNGSLRHKIEADGTVSIGGHTSEGRVDVYSDGPADPVVSMYGFPGFGGVISLRDEAGDYHTALEPDFDGSGGFFLVDGGTGTEAFVVDGSYSGGDPLVGIVGGSSSSFFHTYNTGDDAVELPYSSISSMEMENEPGVMYVSNSSYLTLDGSTQTLLSRSIYCPTNGYVLAIGTTEATINHVNGGTSGCDFGVSSVSGSFPTGGERYCRLPGTAETGNYYQVVTCQWIFMASAGTQTFYFLANEIAGDWSAGYRNLSLVFFPTYYGVLAEPDLAVPSRGTDPPVANFAPGLTEADIAAERAECEAANNARIEAELAAMEAKIAEIRASMNNNR